jgi:hypothetical protein
VALVQIQHESVFLTFAQNLAARRGSFRTSVKSSRFRWRVPEVLCNPLEVFGVISEPSYDRVLVAVDYATDLPVRMTMVDRAPAPGEALATEGTDTALEGQQGLILALSEPVGLLHPLGVRTGLTGLLDVPVVGSTTPRLDDGALAARGAVLADRTVGTDGAHAKPPLVFSWAW